MKYVKRRNPRRRRRSPCKEYEVGTQFKLTETGQLGTVFITVLSFPETKDDDEELPEPKRHKLAFAEVEWTPSEKHDPVASLRLVADLNELMRSRIVARESRYIFTEAFSAAVSMAARFESDGALDD